MTRIEIHEPTRRLGRHVNHDSRSKNFRPKTASTVVSVNHTAQGLPLNQRSVGKCTCEALCGALNSAPNFKTRVYNDTDTDTLYELETKLEGTPWFPSNPTVNDVGGSGLEVCKAAQQLGWITSYSHALSIDEALAALVLRPVITGVNWYTSFDSPSSAGLVTIAPGATVRGGHEILADQIDASNQLVWFWNSWGPQFGVGGKFCMSFSTWQQLLSEQGDVTIPEV